MTIDVAAVARSPSIDSKMRSPEIHILEIFTLAEMESEYCVKIQNFYSFKNKLNIK